jgi:hypothetical protein
LGIQQDFPSVVPPPPEFGQRNTPILAPPPEFSDARDHHEAATRFNQGLAGLTPEQQAAAQQQFNRQSPMYRSISHAHSSTSSMYSGYPTMTRQQCESHLTFPLLCFFYYKIKMICRPTTPTPSPVTATT